MRRALALVVTLLLVGAVVPAASAVAVGGTATIHRDGFGVPHVFAARVDRLFHGMGYAAADDRLWQAEVLRRAATGTLAELLGPDALPGDVQSRALFGPESRRAEAFAAASTDLQTIITSYVAGINARIDEETAAGSLPVEFGAFGLTPRPWTVDDSIAIFMLLGSQFGWSGADELSNFATWQALDARFGADAEKVFGDLFWLDDPDAPTTQPLEGAIGQPGRRTEGPPSALLSRETGAVAARFAENQRAVDEAFRLAGIPEEGWASNAIAIGSRLSRDGHPLLLGGPQMGYSTPQINHEVGLHGAGFDVTGMTIAGVPLIPIGVGNGYAWTLTSGGANNTDIYAETLNPADLTQYLFEGEWLPLACRVEEWPVAGTGSHSETLCSTVHGPIIGAEGTTAFSLKNVTVGEELSSLDAWIGLGRVRNIRQFSSNLVKVSYNFNVLYADRTGNIAYWHIGHVPIRPAGTNPFFPLPGTGEAEWQGNLPFAEMPHALNPDQDFLVSWNNKPAPGWENASTNFWMWGGAHRVNTMINQLKTIPNRTATVETVEELNRIGGWTTDTPTGTADSVFVSTYLDEMLAAVDTTADPRLAGIAAELGGWDQLQVDADQDGFYDGANGTIFNAWWFALAEGVFDEVADLTDIFVLGNLVDRMLRGDEAALPLQYDYLQGATVGQAVTGALVTALDQLTVEFGSPDPSDWQQPISIISWDPIGAVGVPNTIWMNRGTYNQIVHLRGNVSAENVIAPGQSGDPTSPHFADQLDLYATWTYKEMLLTRSDILQHSQSVLALEVP